MEDKKDVPPACFGADQQATERLKELFIDKVQIARLHTGQCPAERAVFRKLHGVAHAELVMLPDRPADLRVGFLAHERLAAWIRFSSDTQPTLPDLESTLGVGLKLFGVPGPKALGEDGDTADLILQNHPVFFVDNAADMAAFTYAGIIARDYPGYQRAHPTTDRILREMAKVEGSVLTASYWAILPFHAGENQFIKYKLEPETAPENIANDAPDYLAIDMARRLAQRDYRFRLMVQRRTDPTAMPLDQATVEWPESQSPYVPVATLVIPRQDIHTRGQAEYGQSLSFNIWRVPPEQRPTGSLAEARKVVYATGARVRHEANGQPLQDPPQPRPATLPVPDAGGTAASRSEANGELTQEGADDCIVQAVIYPAIGVARVGSSPDEWFIGPEVPEPAAAAPGFYRDAHKRLKRQAARFRIYGVNTRGDIVRELDASNAEIEWKVTLANHKAAWYAFQLAQDIPEAASAPPTTLRNPAVQDRSQLSITPRPRHIHGTNAGPHGFDDGQFMGKAVNLGELRTDEAGRLIVLGGLGVSASYDGSRAVTFGNNQGWHDDVSDGPVTAHVRFNGKPLLVTPAWVVVAPPNYGPQRKSVRTLWDLMRDVAISAGTLGRPPRPSFRDDILPIFERMAGLQWVNAGFAAGFGWKGQVDLTSPEALKRLSSASGTYTELRRSIANQFRRYEVDAWSPKPWPWLYGDAMNIPAVQSPRQNTSLTATQLGFLDQWAAGDFIEDHDPQRTPPRSLEEIPLAQRGDTLTRAALEFCLADAFHPGCEMTWPVRSASMYMAPFRFLHAPEGWQPPPPGELFTPDDLTLPNGPLGGQMAGGITRWMAVPWQTDTASCRSGYDAQYDPYVPSFWPARVPNQVLTKENYDIVMDTERSLGERMAAFAQRAAWINPLGDTSYTEQINNMIAHYDHLGVVEPRIGPPDREHFPDIIEVEDQHRPIHDVPMSRDAAQGHHVSTNAHVGAAPRQGASRVDLMRIDKVRRFPNGLR